MDDSEVKITEINRIKAIKIILPSILAAVLSVVVSIWICNLFGR